MDGLAERYVKTVLALGQHDKDYVDAYSDKWAGIESALNAYSKKYWTSPYMVE